MQRATSAVDFSSLLNPASPTIAPSRSTSNSEDQKDSARATGSSGGVGQDTSMAAAAVPSMPPPLVGGMRQPAQEHTQQGLPRPYKCTLCDKAFHRLEHQTRHVRTHTGEKPHICQFPRCTKRFSRSDELTRHSRIHNNPNARRNAKTHNVAAMQSYAQDQAVSNALMPPSSRSHISQSAPTSKVGSPNVSPPNSYSAYNSNTPSVLNPSSNRGSPPSHQQNRSPLNINLLASAASQVEREDSHNGQQASVVARHHHHHHHHHHPYYVHPSASANRLPSLSQYAYSQNMSRSHSHSDSDEHHHHHLVDSRPCKRSRPNSPLSSAGPSSPTFSHRGGDSYSPTPDHTPLATPAHSPRLRPYGDGMTHSGSPGIQLPSLRHLTLTHPPALAPLEPHMSNDTSPFGSLSSSANQGYLSNLSTAAHHEGARISDIMSRDEGAKRTLPVPSLSGPKMGVQDLLNPVVTITNDGGSGFSSRNGSQAGNDLETRMY